MTITTRYDVGYRVWVNLSSCHMGVSVPCTSGIVSTRGSGGCLTSGGRRRRRKRQKRRFSRKGGGRGGGGGDEKEPEK